MQVQGICPYGWHIANMSDWKDLIYAVAESSKSYSDYPWRLRRHRTAP